MKSALLYLSTSEGFKNFLSKFKSFNNVTNRFVAGEEMAQAIQLAIEYDPQPPFDAGSPEKAPAAVVERLRSRSRFIMRG